MYAIALLAITYFLPSNTLPITIQNLNSSDYWGLDILNSISFDNKYFYNSSGSGVNVYVIDTGIDTQHPEFTGRAKIAYSLESTPPSNKCLEHGTHVAGIIGGVSTGVSKNVTIWSVQGMNCHENISDDKIINMFEWVKNNHVKPAIINYSMGLGESEVHRFPRIEKAIGDLISSGIIFINSAGNSNSNTGCQSTPSVIPGVITVGAMNSKFQRASFSNWGDCIEFYAPGEGIYSTMPNNKYAFKSGTSQAAPFVTGIVALYLEQHPTANYTEIVNVLQNYSLKNRIGDTNTYSNFLIQSLPLDIPIDDPYTWFPSPFNGKLSIRDIVIIVSILIIVFIILYLIFS